MAGILRSVLNKQKEFDFEVETKRLRDLPTETVLQIKDFNMFYAEKYGDTFVVIEDHNGNLFSTFSKAIKDEFTRAYQMRLEGLLKGKVVQVITKTTLDGEGTYQVLQDPDWEVKNQFQVDLIEARKTAKEQREAE